MKLTSIQTADYVGMTASLPLVNGVTTLTGPNAGGKTLLAGVVPNILFAESALKPGSTIGMTWENDADKGSMFITRNGNKSVYRGTINGEAKEHNTIKPATAWMREHLPISEAVFTTANYLAAFRSGTMLGGKPAARMQLLSDIVELRVFDTLRSGVSKLASSTNITVALRERIMSDLRELSAMADTQPKFSLAGVSSIVSEKRSNLRSKLLHLQDALDDRPFGNLPTDTLDTLLEIAPERNKAWDAWHDYHKSGIELVLRKPTKQQYKAALAALEIDGMGLARFLTGEVKPVENLERNEAKLQKLRADISVVTEQLDHLDGHTNSCPTCNSVINGKALVKSLKLALVEMEAAEKKQNLRVVAARSYAKLKAKIAENDTTPEAVKARLKDYDDVIKDYEVVERVEAKWGGKTPTKPDKPYIDLGELTAEVRLRRKGYGTLAEDEKRYAKLSAKFQGATGVLTAVTGIVEEEAEANANRKRLRALREELAALPNSDDAELLLELLKALENRNARNKYLDLVGEHLIESLNDLAPRFFPYKIEFAWTNGKLLAKRKGATTDVVLLSGREGRAFMLLNAVATQYCLPASRRLRTLFIDELEAGSSPENRQLLAELIPQLLSNFDNILVITPLAKSEFYIEGPRYRVIETGFKKSIVREE